MSALPRLTIGMACYDDFEGVWATVNALRLYHSEQMPDVEILVVDNHPDSAEGACLRRYLHDCVPTATYVDYAGAIGSASAKDMVFRQARGEAVLCIDSHVLLAPGALKRLMSYYDAHPQCLDLLQGPVLHDDLRGCTSRLEDAWQSQMWGVWATDDNPNYESNGCMLDSDESPTEIAAQGLGLFSCRKEAWLGFHPRFRGYGGEEFYIHEKFRQAGRRTLCLPFLRWMHRFERPRGVPYPLAAEHRFRNYVLGLTELGLPLEPAIEQFSKYLAQETMQRILRDPERIPDMNRANRRPPKKTRNAWRRFLALFSKSRPYATVRVRPNPKGT